VKTDLMNKEPDTVDSPIGAFIGEMLRAGVDDGIPAGDVADQVLDAIRGQRFWILTHPDMSHYAVERMERAAAQINPPLFGSA
jgi:hypothetical protein